MSLWIYKQQLSQFKSSYSAGFSKIHCDFCSKNLLHNIITATRNNFICLVLSYIIISFGMSVRKIIGNDGGIEQLLFQVFPKTITLPRSTKCFVLYLEKGMQIMGKFQSNEGTSLKDSFYRFRHPQPAIFRIHNLAHSDYTWSLYSVNPQTTEENLQDSATFNIERTIKLYQIELLEKQREIQTSIRERNVTRTKVLQLWGMVRKEMKSCRSAQKCVFTGHNYQIEFQVEIKNALDFQLQRMEEQQNIETLRRSPFDPSRSNHHNPKPQPNEIELDSAYHSSPFKQDEPITKETIQRDLSSITIEEGHPSPNDEDFNAIVKIVDPQGQEIADKSEDAQRKGLKATYSDNLSYYGYPATGKKFSLLSDIIQRSHEGSSSFGNPDRSSSNGRLPFRKDTALDIVIQPQTETSAEPLNKFKTLPYDSHHRLEAREGFRRAQTAQKTPSQNEPGSQIRESYISDKGAEADIIQTPPQVKVFLKDISMKWRIFAVILLIFILGAAVWKGALTTRKPRRKVRSP